MSFSTGQSWLLDAKLGWGPVTAAQSLVAESGAALALAPERGARGSIDSPDGCLGGLVLPKDLAVDSDGTIYLVDRRGGRVRRLARGARSFADLPAMGRAASGERVAIEPASIALAANRLFLVDVNRDVVQIFGIAGLELRQTLHDAAWRPVDIAIGGDYAYILDSAGSGRVWRHQIGADGLEPLNAQPACGRWTRIACDCEGRVYLLRIALGQAKLEVFSPTGTLLETVGSAASVRDRFVALPVSCAVRDRRDDREWLLPIRLLCVPSDDAGGEARTAVSACARTGGLLFDESGEPTDLRPEEARGAETHAREGQLVARLDSQIPRCHWDRIRLTLDALPPRTRVRLDTFSDDAGHEPDRLALLPASLWQTGIEVEGDFQPQPGSPPPDPIDMLVRSAPGRFLWLRVSLFGDGYETPRIESIHVHFPRESAADSLPEVFSTDPDDRAFLERFLGVFQFEWDELERRFLELDAAFDPRTAPDEAALERLARWFGVETEEAWGLAQNRRWVHASLRGQARRGTPEAIREVARVTLENISRVDLSSSPQVPALIEGFRARARFALGNEPSGVLGGEFPMWSPSCVSRLQLDVHATEGEVRLVSTGDPQRDVFHEHAHRYTLFVPAPWIEDDSSRRMLERSLNGVTPAHVVYEICPVQPRLCVGVQSTLGVDAVVGDIPATVLGGTNHGSAGSGLGQDTVLGSAPTREIGPQLASDGLALDPDVGPL